MPSLSSSPSSSSVLDAHDEDVLIAVKALDDMRNSTPTFQPTPALSTTSTSTSSPPLPSPSSDPGITHDLINTFQRHDHPDIDVNQPSPRRSVSQYPLVNTALKAYEQGKASSRVVKYGADLMESTAKTISKPVIERLPVNGQQLDEFACRQLDRLGNLRRSSSSSLEPMHHPHNHRSANSPSPPPSSPPSSTMSFNSTDVERGSSLGSPSEDVDVDLDAGGDGDEELKLQGDVRLLDEQREGENVRERGRKRNMKDRNGRVSKGVEEVPVWLEATSPYTHPPCSPSPPPSSRSQTPQPTSSTNKSPSITITTTRNETETDTDDHDRRHHGDLVAGNRSRWQAVLSEAGGLGAAVSEESMRRLRYCLQWLQYATSHIDDQILILRDFIITLQTDSITMPTAAGAIPASGYSFPPSDHNTTDPNTPEASEPPTRTNSRSSSVSAAVSAAATTSSSSSSSSSATLNSTQLKQLTTVRHDVVHTIRQVVDVVSKYAGSALPGPARARVKGLILCLPQKWATAASSGGPGGGGGAGGGGRRGSVDYLGVGGGGAGRRASVDSSGVGSAGAGGSGAAGVRGRREQRREKMRERGTGGGLGVGVGGGLGSTRSSVDLGVMGRSSPVSSRPASPMAARREAAATVQAAQRILTLATESLDMMRGVTGVVKDSLERAEGWVNRLRVVGIQSGGDGLDIDEEGEGDDVVSPIGPSSGRGYEWPATMPFPGEGKGEGMPVDGGCGPPGVAKMMGDMKLGGEMDVEGEGEGEGMDVDE